MKQTRRAWRKGPVAAFASCRFLSWIALVVMLFGLAPGGSVEAVAETVTTDGAAARALRIAVLFPDIGEPYRSIFVSITKGIEAELGSPPVVIPLSDENAESLRARIAADHIEACIALGRTTIALVETLQLGIPIVRGAVFDPNVPATGSDSPLGISLTPDPALLLSHLKGLAPGVTRVTVVYNGGQALIDRAVDAGRELKLSVTPHKAEDLLEAAAIYKSVISKLGSRDALWIPQDPQAVDEKVILPMLLNAAWEQNFVLFSSNADHAKRGVLYSVYPDNLSMGRRLARIAGQRVSGLTANTGMQPLEDLLIAVNLRTAEHLRLNLSSNQIRSFDLTFPQR